MDRRSDMNVFGSAEEDTSENEQTQTSNIASYPSPNSQKLALGLHTLKSYLLDITLQLIAALTDQISPCFQYEGHQDSVPALRGCGYRCMLHCE